MAGFAHAGAADPPLTLLQRGVEDRKSCYHEALVRNAHLTHPGWIKELGWGPEVEGRYYSILTACDMLRYRRPSVPTCASLREGARPLAPLDGDDSVFRPLARLELAARYPERAASLFPWRAEKIRPAAYWRRAIGDLHQVHLLEDNADFGLNVLIRLLLLHGEVPRATSAPWRSETAISANFDPAAQARIETALLAFKYWHDEPFRAVDEPGLRRARRDRVVADHEASLARGEKPGALSSEQRDADGPKFSYEMQYWSENHQILFATAEYLAGQWLPGDVFRPGESFRSRPASGYRDLTGRARVDRARERVGAWLDDRLRFGFSEWNAPGYYDEHILALMNLVDFALDRSIRHRATMVLDLILFDLARYTVNGMFGVAASRSHFKHKNCGWHESVGDIIEMLFGVRHGAYSALNALSACAFASGRRYRIPDVLLKIGRHRPARWIDRTRVSIDWSEAAEHGIGFTSEPDVMRWWSRASWFTKHVIDGTRRVVQSHGLGETKPFQDVLPKTAAMAGALTGLKLGGYVLAGPAFPLMIPLIGDPSDQEDEVADALSVVTEGSAYTRGNIYTYRNRNAILSSTQNHHAGQLSFQGTACQASLSVCATIFTSHPSAGGGIDKAIGAPLGAIAGSTLGIAVGGLLGGAGAVAGGIFGGIKGAEAMSEDVELLPSDSDGPDWWTGSVTNPRVVQVKGAAILAYKPKAFQLTLFGHRFHAWFPQDAFDNLPDEIRGQPPASLGDRQARSAKYFPFRKPLDCNVETGRWVFGRVGEGYVGLFSGQLPHWTHDGDEACKEVMVNAERNMFIIQIGDVDEFGSYDQFVDRVLRARIHINGLNWKPSDFQCSYDIPNGSRLELHYDEDQVRYAGLPFSDDAFPRIENGYAQIAWQQGRYVIQHAGSSLTHDVRTGQRTTGGHLRTLDHPADLRVYSQNMGLFYAVAPYAGTERDRALATLIALLRAEKYDVVGLSEMWHDADGERIARELGDLYPYRLEGPDEFGGWRIGATVAGAVAGAAVGSLFGLGIPGAVVGAVIGKDVPLNSGLLLLSRHPVVAANVTIYRQCAGEDCAANKGALHARIHPAGRPCALDLFLSHTQNLTPEIDKENARDVLVAQIRQLGGFIHACRDARYPAILMGDLNVDALDESDPGLLGHLYAELRPDADLLPTFKPRPGAAVPERPEATHEPESSGVSSFVEGSAPRDVDSPERFRKWSARLDYLLAWHGSLFEASYAERDVVIHQSSPGRDMSDHYGLRARLASFDQLLPVAEAEIRGVAVSIARLVCLQTTSGLGDDEVRFALRLVTGDGHERYLATRAVEVESGDARSLDAGPAHLPDPGAFLIAVASGEELDSLSANDSLGTTSIRFSRLELVAMMGRPVRRTLPCFAGDGGQFALELLIEVS